MTISGRIKNSARNIVLTSTLAAIVNSSCALRNDGPELNPEGGKLELSIENKDVSYSLTDKRGVKEPVDIFLNGVLNERFAESLYEDGYPSGLGGWIKDLKPGRYTIKIIYYNPKSGDKQPNPLVETGTFEIK